MFSASEITLFALTMAAGQFTPGPDLLLILKNVLNHGLRTGLFTVAGICTGVAVHAFLAVTGLAILIHRWPDAFRLFRVTGALYLIWIAVQLARSAWHRSAKTPASGTRKPRAFSPSNAYLEGLVTNLTNPKVVLFFSFMISQFVGPDPLERAVYGSIIVLEAALLWPLFAWLMQRRPVREAFLRRQRLWNVSFAALLFAVAAHLLLGNQA
ncbi:MAG TPA: LysE family translocator [Verrucomicrobiales bacterium]|nr:LysE family translocator [Verrucomicrobiales bacterium]